MRLADLGEFGFIGTIAEKTGQNQRVTTGIGDDAAVTLQTPGMSLLSTADMLAEGVHFDLAWSDPRTLGRKSLAVNLSDIAAMGGVPRSALLSVAIPANLSVEFLNEFTSGFLEQAKRFDVALIGGDTSSSRSGFVISVALLGEQYPDRVVTRRGAKPGNLVCVSGTVGDSSLGLALLMAGERQGGAVGRHLDPEPRVHLGRALAEAAISTAMIDISDGLIADLGHILELSGTGARVDAGALPLSEHYLELAGRYSQEPYSLALEGGEDYELLFTIPPERFAEAARIAEKTGTIVTAIGEIVAGQGVSVALPGGGLYICSKGGYDHFR